MAKALAQDRGSAAKELKELSDWQLERVRDALRAYHRYGRGSDGTHFTWRDVREAIAEYTGFEIGASVKLGAERLRQFVDGFKQRSGARKYPVPQPDAMQAIVAFVTHEELDLLTLHELTEHMPGYQAVLRFAEYLAQDSEMRPLVTAFDLCGDLQTAHPDRDCVTVVTLTLQQPLSESGKTVLQAVEERVRYDLGEVEQALLAHNCGQKEKRLSRSAFGGWGVLTPEDTLAIFLKAPDTGRNHCYYAMNDLGLWQKSGGKLVYLMRHDYGTQAIGTPDEKDEVTTQALEQLFSFTFSSEFLVTSAEPM